jgi:hypothetical protein
MCFVLQTNATCIYWICVGCVAMVHRVLRPDVRVHCGDSVPDCLELDIQVAHIQVAHAQACHEHTSKKDHSHEHTSLTHITDTHHRHTHAQASLSITCVHTHLAPPHECARVRVRETCTRIHAFSSVSFDPSCVNMPPPPRFSEAGSVLFYGLSRPWLHA